MLVLVLWTCLLSDPTVCHDQKIPLSSGISGTDYLMRAPPHIAQWSEEHPQWRIVRWQCRPAAQQDT
ncbi:MAG TPA: hypothetical protein VE665_06235 [Hyphomicrobiaceae bacterium]|jgi:hypothetical protein|nr:hypothetical protein [Hyphomicrobiaceae bacterium]